MGYSQLPGIICVFKKAQMLLNQGELAGVRILGRKTVNMMHTNYLQDDLLPFYVIADPPAYGYGFGLGSRVLMNVAESEKPGSVGEFGTGPVPLKPITGLILKRNYWAHN